MPAIPSDHLFYPSGYPGAAYDMRKVVSWSPYAMDTDYVDVRFLGSVSTPVRFNKADFEAAKTASLAAGG